MGVKPLTPGPTEPEEEKKSEGQPDIAIKVAFLKNVKRLNTKPEKMGDLHKAIYNCFFYIKGPD
jgi:hypothetical protein